MKKKITNNLGMKLLSILAATIIWLIIVNVEDATVTKTLTLTVQEINANAITDEDYTYEPVSGQKATITVKGKSSIVYNITADDFEATADLSKLSITDAVFVDVEQKMESIIKDGRVEITSNTNTYTIKREKVDEKTVSLVPSKNGEAAAGYYVTGYQISPNSVTIRGSHSSISNIKEIVAAVNVSGASESFTQQVTPKVIGLNNEEMDTSKLTFNGKALFDVKVDVTVQPTKEVKIDFQTTGTPAAGYEVTAVTAVPEEITVAGPKEALAHISEIPMTLDISGESASIEKNLPYDEVLKGINENLQLVKDNDKDNGLAVTVTIEKKEHKTVEVAFDRVRLDNSRSDDYTYELAADTDNIPIDVTGVASVIESFTAEDLNISADVSGMEEGTHTVFLIINSTKAVTIPHAQKAVSIKIVKK